MEQVREFDGEQAYEKKMRAMEKARPREGQASGEGKASGEILEASGAQKAGAGLWPQPLGLSPFCGSFCLRGCGRMRQN